MHTQSETQNTCYLHYSLDINPNGFEGKSMDVDTNMASLRSLVLSLTEFFSC